MSTATVVLFVVGCPASIAIVVGWAIERSWAAATFNAGCLLAAAVWYTMHTSSS